MVDEKRKIWKVGLVNTNKNSPTTRLKQQGTLKLSYVSKTLGYNRLTTEQLNFFLQQNDTT